MVGGKGTGGKGDAATINGAVASALAAIHAVAANHTAPPAKPPRRRTPVPLRSENVGGQNKPQTRASSSAGRTRDAIMAARRAAAGVATPSDVAFQRANPAPTAIVPELRSIDKYATGGIGAGVAEALIHPERHWQNLNPPPARNAQGGLLPLAQQPVTGSVIPWGPVKRLFGGTEPVPVGRDLAIRPPGRNIIGEQSIAPLPPKNEVSAALRGAKVVRGRQEAGYSVERSKRAKAAEAAMRANPGIEGHRAALAALRGELPKINFGGFTELTPEALDALAVHIHEHPHLMPFQKITAVGALERATEGKVPTHSEIRLLTNIFGKDTALGLQKIHTLPDHIKNVILETLNVPRSIMASFDLSAPFRQGLMAGARHPAIFAKNFKPMIQSFAKEGNYQAIQDEIRARPTFHMMEAAKLALTDLGDNLSRREENLFGYGMAEKIPVAGHGIKASGRAYNAFLTKMRADVFDHLVKGFEEQGINVHDQKFLEGLGKYINASTGRGDLGVFKQAAPYLNTLFFSPRLLASRLNFLNPVFYARLPAPVRREALRSALQLTGLVSTTLGLAAYAGAKVVTDPRNADFAKIKLGNTRLDILGGFQQPIRLLSQLEQGKIISSTTGDALALGPQGPGAVSRRDILQRFFEGKLAPTPSIINDWFKGTDFQGQPFSWKKETVQHMIPLLAQDAADVYNQQGGGAKGLAAAAAGYGIGSFGIGLQTYGPSTSKSTGYEKKLQTLGLPMRPVLQRVIDLAGRRKAAQAKYPSTAHGRFHGDLDLRVEIGAITPQERDAALAAADAMSEYALVQALSKRGLSTKIGAKNKDFDPTGYLGRIDAAVSRKARGG